jgi:SAM-dependent methyltransferase
VPEFTGERVIPGLVELDLWNEHISRYAFASRFASSVRALDMGCGTGYGAAALAQQARHVQAVDQSSEAVAYAREHFPLPNLRFDIGAAENLPYADAAFELITAFELIEHLEDWRALLREAHRLLAPNGFFLVSTPNKRYYAETRAEAGENPFHVHEFDHAEFVRELSLAFPEVEVLLQNRVESFAFHRDRGPLPALAEIAGGAGSPEDAHFFVAVCSKQPWKGKFGFVYVPRAANLLREREQHVAALEQQLDALQDQHRQLIQAHEEQGRELEEHNLWARQTEQLWKQAQARVVEVQDAFAAEQQKAIEMAAAYDAKIRELEADIQAKTEWAHETERRLTAELKAKCDELYEAVRVLTATEGTLEERTRWARQLDEERQKLQAALDQIRSSRWLRVGRAVGLGPKVDGA